jgi:hypothetical protein
VPSEFGQFVEALVEHPVDDLVVHVDVIVHEDVAEASHSAQARGEARGLTA